MPSTQEPDMPDDGQGSPQGPRGRPPPPPPPPGTRRSGGDLRVGGRQLPIRPMSVGDVLDGAFSALRATFVPVTIVVVVVLGPLQLALNLVLSRISPGLVAGPFADLTDLDDVFGSGAPALAGVSLLFGIVSLVVSLIASAAVVELALQVDRGEPTDVARALRGAWSVFWDLLGASVLLGMGGITLATVAVLFGVLVSVAIPVVGIILVVVLVVPVFVIGGAAVLGAYGMLVAIAVIERRGPITTLGRAMWVVRRRFWRLVGITLLIGLLAALATVGLQLPFTILAAVLGSVGWVFTTIGEVLGQIVVVPITAFGALLVYLDARVRHEGLDLELRARGVVGGA